MTIYNEVVQFFWSIKANIPITITPFSSDEISYIYIYKSFYDNDTEYFGNLRVSALFLTVLQ